MKKILQLAFLFVATSTWASPKVDLLLTNAIIVTMNANFDVIEHGAIAVRGSSIVYVGHQEGADFDAKQTIDVENKIVIPGLINGHTHIPMTLLRGISDDMELMEWLTKYIWPAEGANVDSNFVYWGTLLGCLEMIETGTTTFVDMYFFEGDIARATKECGLRAILAETVIDFPVPDSNAKDKNIRWSDSLQNVRTFVNQWKNDELITPAIGPHAPYTLSPEHLKDVSKLSKELNIPVHMHLSETKHEAEQIRNSYGVDVTTPIQYVNDLGLLSSNLIAAHTVFATPNDIQLMANARIGVASCPQSNLKLGSGIASIDEYLNVGLATCLGTDSAASNNDLILWEEMNLAAMLLKGYRQNPKIIDAKTAFTMATIGGAKAIHKENEIGSIEIGKKADMIVVDNQSSHQIPYSVDNIYSQLVYATKGSYVETTIVHGKILMQDRKILHLNRSVIYSKALELRQKINASITDKK